MTESKNSYSGNMPGGNQQRDVDRYALITAGLMAVATVAIIYSYGIPDSIYSATYWAALVSVTALVCIWLNRRGQADLGLGLLIGSIQLGILMPSFENSGLAIGFVAIGLITTFSFSQLMKSRRWANFAVAFSIAMAGLLLYFDLFEPFKRIPNPNVLATWIITGGVVLVYAIIVLRRFPTYSLRSKLLVTFIGVTVLATGALGLYSYNSTTEILQNGLERELKQHADGIAFQIGDLLDKQINLLAVLTLNEVLQQDIQVSNAAYQGGAAAIQAELAAKDEQWRAADSAGNNADPLVREHMTSATALDLAEFQAVYPANLEVFITDLYGGLVGTSRRISDYYQADEAWWQAAYNNGQGAIYISNPSFDESVGELSLLIALPVRNRDTGEMIGILRTTYLLSVVTDVLSEKVGETGETDLFFPGDVVYHIHGGEYAEVTPEEFEQIQAIASEGITEAVFDGLPSVLARAPLQASETNPVIDALGWIVVFHQTQQEAFAPVNQELRGIIVFIVVVLVLAVLAAFGVSLIVIRPIVQLTATAQKISAGNYETRAEVTSSDEIGILATAFNTMTSRLREFIGTLEQRVSDRTRALAISGEISRRLSTLLDQDKLVSEVVEQLKSGFNYYHAHIYLLSEDGQTLNLAGGTGEAGKILLARKHALPAGRGLVGRAAESKAVVLVPDTLREAEWLPNPLLPDTKSEIAVPILLGEQVLGVLDVQNDVAGSLGQQDADLIRTIADQVAIALQNIRSSESVAKRAAELQTVAAISTSISTIQNVEEMLQTVVHLTQRRFGLYHAHVFLYDQAADELAITACGYKEGDEHEGTHGTTVIPLAQEQSLVARAARTRQPVIVNDVRSDPGWLPNPLLPDTSAELAVPMIVGGQLLGVLDVQSENINVFTEEDASIQTTLASQVAVALQNARSFAQTRHQAERESTLNLITQKIQGTTSMEEALKITARELGHALGKKATFVSLESSALAGKEKGIK